MAPPHALDVLRSALLKIRSRVLDGHEFRPATAASLGHIVDDAIEQADALSVDGTPPFGLEPAVRAHVDEWERKLRQLVNRCPVGYHQGKLITLRSFTDADMISWLAELDCLATGEEVPARMRLPPPLRSGAEAMRDAVPMRPNAPPEVVGEADALEAAYWTFDARRAGRYKRDPHGVLGPQEERDAFKAAVREHVTAYDGPQLYRDTNSRALASPKGEAAARAEHGDGDGSIPRAAVPPPCPSNECQIRQQCTGSAACTGQHRNQNSPPVGWRSGGPKLHQGPRATDERLTELARQYETISLNAASAAELRGLAIELLAHRKLIAKARGFDPNSPAYRLEKLEAARGHDIDANRDRADAAEVRIAKLEADRTEDVARADALSTRIAQLEVTAANHHTQIQRLELSGPGLSDVADTMIFGRRQVPSASEVQEQTIRFAGVSRAPKREHPLHGRARTSGSFGRKMPVMDDGPLEWDESSALDRHRDLAGLVSLSAIRAALWERGEWVKPFAPATPKAEAPKVEQAEDRPWWPSELTYGELESIRKTCETYSSDSCWRQLLAAFDAVCASERAAKAEAKIANALLDRAKASAPLTVNPDSDFAKAARGEAVHHAPSGFSFEVNVTGPHMPDCDVVGCLGCGVVATTSTLPAPDADGLHRVQLTAEQTAKPGRFEGSVDKLSLEDFRAAVAAASDDGVVSAGAIAEFLVECYGERTKAVVVALRTELGAAIAMTSPPPDVASTAAVIDDVLVELDKAIALAITDVSAAVARIEAKPTDDIPF